MVDIAAGILEKTPVREKLGFKKGGKASIAYARKCLEAQRATQKKDEAEAKLINLRERLFSLSVWGCPRPLPFHSYVAPKPLLANRTPGMFTLL